MSDEKRFAPTGAVWVCGACGKTSKDRYGDGRSSWDESCMLNAILCFERQPGSLDWVRFQSQPDPAAS